MYLQSSAGHISAQTSVIIPVYTYLGRWRGDSRQGRWGRQQTGKRREDRGQGSDWAEKGSNGIQERSGRLKACEAR